MSVAERLHQWIKLSWAEANSHVIYVVLNDSGKNWPICCPFFGLIPSTYAAHQVKSECAIDIIMILHADFPMPVMNF